MMIRKYTGATIIAFFVIVLAILLLPNYGTAYNKSWDQGHKCVRPFDGKYGWGRYGYDTTDQDDFKGGFSSKECCELLCKICPVYAHTGRLQKTFTDLMIPGVGPSLTITRTYLSQERSTSLLGHGWIFNFGKRLIIQRNKAGDKIVVVRQKTGEINFFKEHPDSSLERLTSWGLTYDLIKNTDNTYTIVSRNGTWYELREDGKIAKIVDRNQNELVFSYNSVGCLSRITNASGNYVDFQLGVNGKIASVSDNVGRTISYTYDENGNLTSVTDPMGNATQYVYNSNNLLTQIIDARGNIVESATYDNNQPPRVSTFVEKGETYTIAYFDGRTEKTDSQGNKWTYYFNDVGIIERVIDPLGNETKQQLNKVTSTSVDWDVDLNGNRTTYTYDGDGNIASKTDPLWNTWTYTYITGTDLLESTIDPLGGITRNNYDSNGNLTLTIRNFGGPLESTISYTYDDQGNKISETDPLGNTIAYEYNANGKLIKRTDPLGNITTYTYDNRGNRFTEMDALGNTTSYTYNLLDQLTSVTDALGNMTSYTYDANGNKFSETNANGNTRSFVYDAYDRLVQGTDSLGNTTSYSYDSRDNLTSKTDPNGNITTYTYDILNRLIRVTNSLTGQKSYTYDAEGNRLTITDENGNTTAFNYNAINQLISKTSVSGEATSYTYDANGNQISQTQSNGNIITRSFDALNRFASVSDSIGVVRNNTYNSIGLLISVSDALENVISYSYDADGRLIQKSDPMGNNTSYTYNAVGDLISSTDREGNTTNYSYDALGRKIAETDPLGHTTTFSYDNIGNLLSVTDANGNVTSYQYNNANWLTEVTYADSTQKTFSYDANGNCIRRADNNGNIISYTFDDLNRNIFVDHPGSNDSTFSYDAAGNLLAATNQNASISFTYDNSYRITQAIQNTYTLNYSYNNSDNSMTITYPNGKVVKEIRNLRGFLTGVENATSQPIVQYSYNDANLLVSKNYSNGISASFAYNTNRWVTEINYTNGGSQIEGINYGFDNEGNILFSSMANVPSNSEKYLYDARYRLTQFIKGTIDNNGNVINPISQSDFTLDPLSNWVSTSTDSVSQTRAHNEMNELVSINGGDLLYDNNGNLTDDGSYTYEYDFENRLTKVLLKSNGAQLVEYKYNVFGRRVQKITPEKSITYVYNGARVIEERDENNNVIASYIYGKGIDEVISIEYNANIYYYILNQIGSIIMLVDSSANVVEQYEYTPYGKATIKDSSGVVIDNSTISNPYFFTGRRYDNEAGIYYYRSRYYHPEMGRFMKRDLAFIDSMNLYEYTKSNPINYFDPSGFVTGSFTGGESRGGSYPPRGVTTLNLLSYNCSCTSDGCQMNCTFNMSAPIRIVPDSDPIWQNSSWDSRYNNTTGTVQSRVQNVRDHERDHQQTLEGFYNYNKNKMEEEESKRFDSLQKCNNRVSQVLSQVQLNWNNADSHCRSFDDPLWWSGNQYANHPLSNQTWLAN